MLNKITDFVYRMYRIIVRQMIKYSSNPRPASYPFITGDGFRALAQHIYDDLHPTIDPGMVKENDIVFVGDSRIKNFLKKINPDIKNKYVLITHNGDESVDEEAASMMSDNIIKWYGINVTTTHPKIIPIPLGLGNKHYYVTGIPSIFINTAKKNYKKNNKIFYGFITSTNPAEREPALAIIKRNKFAETVVKWLSFQKYMRLLATYKLVLSPPGSSVEGHRTWEALYVGVIPIVKSSVTMDYFKKLNMPLWVVKDWNEIDKIDEKAIEENFDKLTRTGSQEVLYMNYWKDKIMGHKD